VTAETEDDLIKRFSALKDNVENRGMKVTMNKSYGTMRHIRLEISEILHIFPLAPKVWEIGDPKRLT